MTRTRTTWFARLALVWGSAALLVPAASAQDRPAATVGGDRGAYLSAMLKAMTPGPEHKVLASLAGEWTFASKTWFDPSLPPAESSGTATNTMTMEGRYLQGTMKGTLMGMPFEGFGVTAFDTTTGQYQSVWFDNMSTTLMFMTGSYDAAARTFTMRTEMSDLEHPSATIAVRQTLTIVDADVHRMELFETTRGRESRMLEIVFTRKK